MNEERELAKILTAEIGEVYNGMIGLRVTFDYEAGGCQGLGAYLLDAAFVIRFMRAVGVLELKDAVGKSVWVTHTHSSISKVEPLHKKDGKPFVISEWQEWLKSKNINLSYADLAGDVRGG